MDSQSLNQNISPSPPQEEEIEINLLEIFYFLWDRLWQIILCALLLAALFFGYDYLNFNPQYTATAKVYVTPVSDDPVYNESTLDSGGNLVSDCRELLLTRPVLQQVVDGLGLEMEWDQLKGMVSVNVLSGSRLLTISATGGDPQQAADIANQLALLTETELAPITNTVAPQVVETALVPIQQSNPTPVQEAVKGGLLGAFLWCGVLLIWYFCKNYGYLLKRPESAVSKGKAKKQ